MTKGRLIRGLGLATGLMLALAGGAQAAEGGDVVTAGEQPYPLANAKRVVVQGEKVAAAASADGAPRSSCRLPKATLSLRPRERAIELRQLSLNLRTCRAVFERGVPPKSAHATSPAKPEGPRARTAPDGGVSAQSHGYQWGGYAKAWYSHARTGGTVNQVESGVDWDTSGSCIGANEAWFDTFHHRESGWKKVFDRWSFVVNRCDYVSSTTDARFRDRRFKGCKGGPGRVDVFFDDVKAVGYPNGNLVTSRRSWVEPSCPDTLFANLATVRRAGHLR